MSYLREGWFEYLERAFFFTFLRPGDSYLDIGAHVGLHAVAAASLVGPKGQVICIEPNEIVLGCLERNTSNLGPVTHIHNCAIADKNGRQGFESASDTKAAYAHLTEDPSSATSEVNTRKLEDLWTTEQWPDFTLIKVDIEGAELSLFSSSKEFLRDKSSVFMVEFSNPNLSSFNKSSEELENVVREIGLIPCEYDPSSNTLIESELVHPVWYKNYILCRNVDLVNRRLKQVESLRLQQARDIFEKGLAAHSLYDEYQILTREQVRIQTINTSIRRSNASLSSSDKSEPSDKSTTFASEDITDLKLTVNELQDLVGISRSISEHMAEELDQTRKTLQTIRSELDSIRGEHALTISTIKSSIEEIKDD